MVTHSSPAFFCPRRMAPPACACDHSSPVEQKHTDSPTTRTSIGNAKSALKRMRLFRQKIRRLIYGKRETVVPQRHRACRRIGPRYIHRRQGDDSAQPRLVLSIWIHYWSAPRELESFRHKLSTGRSAGFMFETAASNSVGGR